MKVAPGATSVIAYFNLEITGLTVTDLDLSYTRDQAAAVKSDLVAHGAVTDAWDDNECIEVDSTNQPGLYRVDIPNAAFVAGVDKVQLCVNGAAIAASYIEVELNIWDSGRYKVAATTGAWETAGTWEDGVVPAAGATAGIIIEDGVTVTIESRLEIGEFGTQELRGDASLVWTALGAGEEITPAISEGWRIDSITGILVISENRGHIGTIDADGIVTLNNGLLDTNGGGVTTNGPDGTIRDNSSGKTVGTNNGILELNQGTLTLNNRMVLRNQGTITTNGVDGVNRNEGGTVGTDNGVTYEYQTGDSYPIASHVTYGNAAILTQGNSAWITAAGFAVQGDAMALVNDAIKATSYDESTAYPIKSADTGSTRIARTGDNGDTLDTLSIQLDGIASDNPNSPTKGVAFPNFGFLMVNENNHVSGITGLTVAAQISKDGGAFAACANTPATEVGLGMYKIDFTAAEMNADIIYLVFSATGADTRFLTIKTQPT